MTKRTVNLWMDTANFSGVILEAFNVNDMGEIDNHWLVGWKESRHMTVNDLLSGQWQSATYHRKRDAAIKAHKERINLARAELDKAMERMEP